MADNKTEALIQEIGGRLLARMGDAKPGLFGGEGLTARLMEWSMRDASFKLEMFRFVDVFPVLKSVDEIARHIREYFLRPEQSFGFFGAAMGLAASGIGARMGAGIIEKNIVAMARRFIAGETPAEAIPALARMREQGVGFTVDLLGEATVSEEEAETYARRYIGLIDGLVAGTREWAANDRLERAPWGVIPRVNVSVKVSSLYSQIDPVSFDRSVAALKERVRPLLRRARDAGAFINLDLEQYALKGITFALFRELLDEAEFRDFANAGVVVQAYQREAVADVQALVKWAKRRGTPVTVRLVKGAYWDFETVVAKQNGWLSPVFDQKHETDANFEACTALLIDEARHVRTAIGSHNARSIAHAMATAARMRVDLAAIEFQTLYGMAEPVKQALLAEGVRLRDYAPIGELLPGMAYLVRRLLENTSNEGWLRKRFADGMTAEKLLACPASASAPVPVPAPAPVPASAPAFAHASAPTLSPFQNHPPLEFENAATRRDFARAVASVKRGVAVPIVVNGLAIETGRALTSTNPARPEDVLGSVAAAGAAEVDGALGAARATAAEWAATPVANRAAILRRVARAFAEQRMDLAALIVAEAGKPWREADADVCEAIDFLAYYATEAERLFAPHPMGSVLGEDNALGYRARGVAVVIAPWNFPLAILTGMTAAALVTGNTVVMKPAEQTSLIAARLMQALADARLPKGVLHFVPGAGEEVGAALVRDARTDLIAFTGSRDVGLAIVREAAVVRSGQRGVKKVIAEMGGKNAVIVDSDADIDEAVKGIVKSAFDYAGQKCSACSRAIVVGDLYDECVRRLVGATRSLAVGDPADPATRVGPLIDAEAKARVERFIEVGRAEGTLAFAGITPSNGHFVAPRIFTEIRREHRLAQEEIFGPVLAVMRAATFDEAIDIFNSTAYALTGGLFTRSPAHVARARAALDVGNLYVNRGITGALVGRQPFGGFKMSGVGSKAGGPDYLLQFVEPVCVTENTMRRGFSPGVG